MRIIRQDPWECTISFLCSSNNNIKRIKLMLDNLRAAYGEHLYNTDDINYYKFPSLEQLNSVTESEYRDMGFGYVRFFFLIIKL